MKKITLLLLLGATFIFTAGAQTTITQQNGTFTGDIDFVTGDFYRDSNNTGSYNNNENSTIIFAAQPNEIITIAFTEFNTEGCCDGLTISGDVNGNDGTYSGSISPGTIETPIGGSVSFQFISDFSITSSGWSANLSVVNADAPPTAVCMDYTAQLDATGSVTITGANVDGGSSDAEGPVTLSVSPDTFSCADIGTPVTVTLTVTDSMGQMDTCNATVTVEDNVDPMITCAPSDIRDTDPDVCTYDVIGNEFDATFTDNCMSATITNNYNNTDTLAGETLPLGDTIVTWTVDDNNGQTNTCMTTITVEDNQAPVISCTNVVESNDPGTCAAALTITPPTATDNCSTVGGMSMVAGPTTTYNFTGTGTLVDTPTTIMGVASSSTDVTLDLTFDGDHGATSETFALEGPDGSLIYSENGPGVSDCSTENRVIPVTQATWNGWVTTFGTNLTFTLQEDIDVNNFCNNTFQLTANLSASTITLMNDYNGTDDASDTYPVGTTPVTWTATDEAGNMATCIQYVTVEDNEDPVITCVPSDTRDTDPDVCTYDVIGNEFDATFTDNCMSATITNNYNNTDTLAGETLPLGDTIVTWTVDDNNGQTDTCMTTITVEDNQAPVITCSDYTRSTDTNVCQYTVVGSEFEPVFSDNCTTATISNDYNNASSLDGAVFPEGDTVVTWTVDDGNGQMATCTSTITVNDTQAPIIGCPADLIASTSPDSCTAVVVFAQPSVIDNCSAAGDIIITQVTGIPSGGTFPQGVNQVGFSATDEAGNVSFCSFTITVEDNTDPVAVCMDATVTLDNTGNATITAAAVNGGSTDNCGISSSSVDITSFTCADIGPNTVILTVTDINGNTDTCEAIVTVVDTTAPVAVCQDITVELGPDGTVTIDGSLLDDGSSDSCGAGTLTFTTDPAVLNCSDIGQLFVDLIVTDESGNSSTCTAIVTVEDNLDPVLVCQDTTIELGPDGTATVDPMALLDMTNPLDNCGIDVLSVDVTEVNCNDVGGTIDITVFASDNAGNFSSCVATVTVVDTSGPVFDQASLPQGPLTRLIDPATGFYRLEDFRVGVSSTDNCSEGLLPISVSQTPFAGTPLAEGTYDITLTAMDEAGNETDHVFVLMVEPALGVGDNELTLSTLTMYPNPASDKVILSNPQNIQLRDIQVYDLTGRLVQKVDLSETLSETVIDVSTLQSATYMFVITTENASITKQIIKD